MKSRAMGKRDKRTLVIALAMLAPNFVGFLVFMAGPVVFSLIMAFTNWDLTIHNRYSHEAIRFVGLENFRTILSGYEARNFFPYFMNTLYLMIGIPIGIALSLLAALLLERPVGPGLRHKHTRRFAILTVLLTLFTAFIMKLLGVGAAGILMVGITGALVLLGQLFGQTSFRTIFYLPNLTAGVATFILWKALFRPETGPINRMLQPLLDRLDATVSSSPAMLWHVGGWLLYLVAAALLLWFLVDSSVKLRYREMRVTGFIFGLIGVAAVAYAVFYLGQVIDALPRTVQLAHVSLAQGLKAPEWLNSLEWSKPAIIIMGTFMAIGSNNMLLYLAALSSVPVSLHEAAAIDGANKWATFWNVTWPQLAPTTFFIVIMSTIGGLQAGFDQARVMTNGGPAGSTTTLSYYLFNQGFTDFKLGMASAIAWVMFVMIFILTLINWNVGNKMVND